MSLDSLLAFVGILMAIYAIVDSVQRCSIGLFVSRWIVAGSLVLAFLLILTPQVIEVCGCSLSAGGALAFRLSSFMIPVGGVLWGGWQWRRKKLTAKNANGLPELLAVSLRESRFDEAKQIVEANAETLFQFPEVLGVLYERRMVRAFLESRSFVHLCLLTNRELFQEMSNPFRAVDAVLREMLYADTSPLRSAVVADCGGDEHQTYPGEHRQLIETTLQDPEWFALTFAYRPLLTASMEEIWSGRLDDAYNQIGTAYEAPRGIAARSYCPIYLSLKTHVLAIRNAIEQRTDENVDVYVPGPQQLFYAIRQRSSYNPGVWDSELAYWEHPTPYAYLLYEIAYDYKKLARLAFETAVSAHGTDTAEVPDSRTTEIAECWATCVWDVAGANDNVSPDFQRRIIQSYLNFTLQIRYGPTELVIAPLLRATEGLDVWWDVFLKGINRPSWDLGGKIGVLRDALDNLDIGKSYVFDGRDELREALGLNAAAAAKDGGGTSE